MLDDASRKGDVAAQGPTSEVVQAAPQPQRKLVLASPEPNRLPSDETSKVVHIIRRLEEETHRSRTLKRRPWVVGSILACVVLPTFVSALFFLFIASDRFVSEARFAIRSNDTQAIDALGMITGMPSSQGSSNSYIVADYVVSRDMVEELERRLPFRAMYSDGDYFSRLSPTATLQGLIDYWQKHVYVYYDSTKSTIDVQVQAFDAVNADRIAKEIVDIVRNLVNDLSAQSRRDAVQFAASEVARAELRVRAAREDMLKFRMAHNDLDPTATATATLGIAAGLEAERSKLLSDLASVSGYLGEDAPSVQMMKSRIAALAGEVSRIQGQVSHGTGNTVDAAPASGSGDSNALAEKIGTYQELTISQTFAENAYTAAEASLEHARTEADRTQSYLAIYGQPSVAEDATYPRRWLNIGIVFIMATILWGIGSLGVLAIRDHLQ